MSRQILITGPRSRNGTPAEHVIFQDRRQSNQVDGDAEDAPPSPNRWQDLVYAASLRVHRVLASLGIG
jgi:hypothetical protein